MDPRREADLLRQLPFGMDRPVSLADGLPIRVERIVGFTLLIAVYVLLTCLPFAVVFLVLSQADPRLETLWAILGKSFAALWFGSAIWLVLWFIVYVVLDIKHPSTLGRVPGLDVPGENADEEETPTARPAA